jgi:hypothetical protein
MSRKYVRLFSRCFVNAAKQVISIEASKAFKCTYNKQGCGVGTSNLRLRLLNFYISDSDSFIKAKYVLYDTAKPTNVKKGIIRHFITTT